MARGLPATKSVTLHFSRPSYLNLASWAVRVIERRAYSHACIEIVDPASRTPLIFQVTGSGASFMYKPVFLEHNKIVESYEIKTSSTGFHSIWTYVLCRMGSDYSYTALLSIFLRKLFAVRSWFQDGDKTNICSEMAVRICALAGLPMPEDVEHMTPSDLNKYITNAAAHSYAVRRTK